MAIDVISNANLDAGTLSITCSGTLPARESPCSPFTQTLRVTLPGTLVVAIGQQGTLGWLLWAEADLQAPDGPVARACKAPYTDLVGDPTCVSGQAVECATSGQIRMSRIPTSDADLGGLSVEMDVLFGDGLRFQASFMR